MDANQLLGGLSRRVGLAVATALLLVAGAVPASALAAPTGTFQNLAPSAEPLTSVTVDPTTNLFYAQGYEDTPFYKYNPTTNVWTKLAPSPLNSGNNGGAQYLNGKIYTVYTGNATDLGVYDIASNSWTTIPNPLGLGTADITAVGGLLYLAEGNSFVSYDPATSTTKTLSAPPNFTKGSKGTCASEGFQRWGALAPYGGKIYGTQGNDCTGFAAYDIASNSWSELPSTPDGAVAGGTIDPVSGTFFAYGDYNGDSDGSNHFYAYDIASGSWSLLTFPFDDIDDGGMAYVSTPGLEGIYAIEGQENVGFTRYSTIQDSGVTSAAPSGAFAGYPALLTSTVTNNGSAFSPITFTDTLPAGFTVDGALVNPGGCSISGRVVTCTVGPLSPGQSAQVNIVITPASPGSYANSVSVTAPNVTDPNPANNSASATLHVGVAASPKCIVPKLKGTPLKVAKHALRLLRCRIGKIKHVHSRSVRKGAVIKTKPKPGTYKAGKVIRLEVSSGGTP